MDAYLQALVDEAGAVLGDNLVGVYVGGSFALDGYQPGASDIDVAVVVRDTLSDLVKHALVGRLRHEALPCPSRGLELVVYRLDVAKSGTTAPGFELELNTGRDLEFRATYHPEDRPEAEGLFWYAVDRSILHEHGLTLFGPRRMRSSARCLICVRWWRSPCAGTWPTRRSTESSALTAP